MDVLVQNEISVFEVCAAQNRRTLVEEVLENVQVSAGIGHVWRWGERRSVSVLSHPTPNCYWMNYHQNYLTTKKSFLEMK